MAADTIPHRLLAQARTRPDAPAYFEKSGGAWKGTTWRDYVAEVRRASRALVALGFLPGQTTCILGFNRAEWVIFDLATMCAGGAPAGIYTTCSKEEVRYIVHHAEAPIALVENVEQWEKIKAERDNLPLLKHVVLMRGAAADDPMVMTWEAFLAKGDPSLDAQVDERIAELKPANLATLIYTSGTTGPPKGVMLSHENLAWTAKSARDLVGAVADDRAISYLPLSHIAEQMFSVHGSVTAGYAVYYAESLLKLSDNLKEVRPTVFFGVPRIWEKFYSGVEGKLRGATGVKKSLVGWARGVGTTMSAARAAGEDPGAMTNLAYALANKLVFSKLREAIGLGDVRVCVSGAAPIAREIIEFFASLDIMIYEVYGQSEDTGPTSFNQPGRSRFGSVGPVIPGVTVKIAPDGEILVSGPNVFLGYFKEAEATAEALVDGWLHSGDLGEIDAEGFLHITGRKKDIIITAGGKNIAPKNIEGALKNHPLIGEAVVIGDRRKFLTALVALDPEATAKYLTDNRLSGPAHTDKTILDQIQKAMDEVNSTLARVETVKKFRVLSRPFTIEDGELTPTLKVKRKKVSEHFAKEIESMYEEPTASIGEPASSRQA